MSFFPETIKASLGGATVKMSYLLLLDFVGEPTRIWTGFGRLTSGGYTWEGLGALASISGLEQAVNGEAPQASLVLAGVESDIIRLTREEFKTKARDRLARVYLQFHNDANDRPLTLYDAPYAIWAGKMKAAAFDLQSDGKREITVMCESLFSLRSRPVISQYTDADQQRRFPGDLGFNFVGSLHNKVVTWPDF